MRISDWSSDVCSSDLDAIADRLAGQPANEAPVAHHQQAVPGARGDLGVAEAAAPQREQFLALLVLRPPALRQVAEREVRPAAAKIAAVAADVADEAVALTHLWLDADRQSQSLGDDLRGVQGAPVGAGDDAADPASGEAPGHLVRLALALLGELRIDDAGVDAGAGEVPVEVQLPVDRKSVVSGKSVSVRVALGGRRLIKKKNKS